MPREALFNVIGREGTAIPPWTLIWSPEEGAENPVAHRPYLFRDYVEQGKAVMVNVQAKIYAGEVSERGIVPLRQGRRVLVVEDAEDDRYPEVIEPERMNAWKAGVFWMLFRGIEWGFYPPLIFLGIGALTDFGPLLANPRTILLGAAALVGLGQLALLRCRLLRGGRGNTDRHASRSEGGPCRSGQARAAARRRREGAPIGGKGDARSVHSER